MDDAPVLGTPLRLPCGVTLPNRLLKSAMTEGLADAADRPTSRHVTLYRRWSEGGTGTLLTGNVMVDHRYLERPGNVVVEDESRLAELVEWAKAGTAGGNQLWMQISHPGRQCSRMVTSEPVAPSAVQLRLGGLFGKPRALAGSEIPEIIARYARTARIAKRAGFTGVQVHGAHGYLCNQFLSPRTNLRTDEWGGSLENRARFLREAVRAVRREVGTDFPVAVKLNSSDFQKGGFSLEDSCRVASWLVEDGIDLLELSGGTYENARLLGVGRDESREEKAESTKKREAYFLEYAASIRSAAKVPLAVTGGFRSRDAMVAALRDGKVDVIGLARALCTEPDVSARLVSGAAGSVRSDEERCWLGRGFFGPASSSALLRGLNAQAQTAWFYKQLIHLAEGREPELGLTARAALGQHFMREYGLARARNAEHRAPLLAPRSA
ncbi:MAG TPA: NADH:flavin oxidoreductase/NADH oxidase family protein [Polyangiaceae bacterium]|jgi:2,4-dienoyl-CoA reductase-like NADH-dependent reductase (Old Yellow Enzyme family)|nr:NADH:flavin oxidoreductase/NADH oxidase family protein [Polyangiaceae bacterium]